MINFLIGTLFGISVYSFYMSVASYQGIFATSSNDTFAFGIITLAAAGCIAVATKKI